MIGLNLNDVPDACGAERRVGEPDDHETIYCEKAAGHVEAGDPRHESYTVGWSWEARPRRISTPYLRTQSPT